MRHPGPFNNRYQALDTSVRAQSASYSLHLYASLSPAAASLRAVNAPVPLMLAGQSLGSFMACSCSSVMPMAFSCCSFSPPKTGHLVLFVSQDATVDELGPM